MKLEVKNLCKSFDGKEVLHDISFSVTSGKALGLLGRNGAGKTTTIRILMNVFNPDKGEVLIDGQKFNPSKFHIGYLPEERGLYPKKKVIDQIIYLGTLRGLSRKEAEKSAKKWLEKLEISEYEHRLLETLSKGNQQKVQLAQTLVCSPDIVILDEPFSGLDPVNAQILKDVIKELIKDNKLVIFSSHQMSYVEEFCEDIVIINKGHSVLDGNLKNIKKDFGENRLIISASNYSNKELADLFKNKFYNLLSVHDIKNEYVILELCKNVTKNELLKEIMNTDIDLEKFGVYEPSLNDIFVLKAGEQ